MKPREKVLRAHFFQTPSGNEPVREWLKERSEDDRKEIGRDIAAVEYGWPIGPPLCKPMGQGLFEVRTDLADRISRVFFIIDDGLAILLHAIIKKSQETPKKDIALAQKRARDWRSGK